MSKKKLCKEYHVWEHIQWEQEPLNIGDDVEVTIGCERCDVCATLTGTLE